MHHRTGIYFIIVMGLLVCPAASVQAHFGMVISSDTMIMGGENHQVHLSFSFSHPFDGQGMPMDRPRRAAVQIGPRQVDLTDRLTPARIMGAPAWQLTYPITRPGVYQFFMVPQPYWEPAEDIFIIHYTKTIIAAFGDDRGWDRPLGLKTEIIPLSRPFGLYAGNVFRARVLRDGRPLPNTIVEVEFFNADGQARAANDFMVTQTVKTDTAGVFVYSPPVSGWWGFAALSPAGFTLKHDGMDKDVELGAIIWVRFHDWQTKKKPDSK